MLYNPGAFSALQEFPWMKGRAAADVQYSALYV